MWRLDPRLDIKQLTAVVHVIFWYGEFLLHLFENVPTVTEKFEGVSLPYMGRVEDHLKSPDWIITMNREGIYGVSNFIFIFSEHFQP